MDGATGMPRLVVSASATVASCRMGAPWRRRDEPSERAPTNRSRPHWPTRRALRRCPRGSNCRGRREDRSPDPVLESDGLGIRARVDGADGKAVDRQTDDELCRRPRASRRPSHQGEAEGQPAHEPWRELAWRWPRRRRCHAGQQDHHEHQPGEGEFVEVEEVREDRQSGRQRSRPLTPKAAAMASRGVPACRLRPAYRRGRRRHGLIMPSG